MHNDPGLAAVEEAFQPEIEQSFRPEIEQAFQPEIPRARFGQGMAHPDIYPERDHIGRFSEGVETHPDAYERHRGRFSAGQEWPGEADPERHIRRRFSEGMEARGPAVGTARRP